MADSPRAQGISLTPELPQGLPLRKNFAWTLTGNVVYAGCQLGLLVVLAHLGTPAMVGQFALGLAVSTPVMLFANLNLRVVQATDTDHTYYFGDYLALRMISAISALAFIAAIATNYRTNTALVILIVGIAKAIEALSDITYALFQKHERMDKVSVASMARGTGGLLSMAVVMYITRNLVWGLVALAAWWALVLVTYERKTAVDILRSRGQAGERFRPKWSPPTLGKLAWLSLPLGVAAALLSLKTNIPRYFIEYYLGESHLGFFAAMTSFMLAGGIVINSAAHAAISRFAKYYKSNRTAFVRLAVRMALFGAGLGGAGILTAVAVGRPLIALVYGPEYAVYSELLVWLMVGGAVSYVAAAFGTAFASVRRFSSYVIPYTIIILILVALGPWLIKTHGLLGACWLVIAAQLGRLITLFVLLT